VREPLTGTNGRAANLVLVIRRAGPDDADLIRETRLEALADEPSAFGSLYAHEVAMPLHLWRERLASTDAVTFVALEGAHAIGLVVGANDPGDPDVANLFSMWVRAARRGSGVADELVAEVIAWSRAGSRTRLRLSVTDGNVAAERLYARHGFTPTGVRSERARDGAVEVELALSLST